VEIRNHHNGLTLSGECVIVVACATFLKSTSCQTFASVTKDTNRMHKIDLYQPYTIVSL